MTPTPEAQQTRVDTLRQELDAWVVALIDSATGMLLASAGGEGADLGMLAVGATDVMRSQQMLSNAMGCNSTIQGIYIIMGERHHVYQPVAGSPGHFLWAVQSRERMPVALAHRIVEKRGVELLG